MAIPTKNAGTSDTQVVVDWTAVSTSPGNGGSTVLTYNLQWDAGTSGATWTNLLGSSSDSLLTSYTKTTDITSGTTYQFRVRAKNVWGYGDWSSVLSVLAATVPDQPDAATTSYDGTTGDVIISWTAPAARGSTISAYLIEIQDKTASTWTASASCDGSDATILANLQCQIPMSEFVAVPYSYVLSDLIVVRVSA